MSLSHQGDRGRRGRRSLIVLGATLILLAVVVGATQSAPPAEYGSLLIDPLLFVGPVLAGLAEGVFGALVVLAAALRLADIGIGRAVLAWLAGLVIAAILDLGLTIVVLIPIGNDIATVAAAYGELLLALPVFAGVATSLGLSGLIGRRRSTSM